METETEYSARILEDVFGEQESSFDGSLGLGVKFTGVKCIALNPG